MAGGAVEAQKNTAEFDYESVKKIFHGCIRKSRDTTFPKTKKENKYIISVLKNPSDERKFRRYRENFSISKTDENELLYHAGSNAYKVIPVDEMFDIIMEAHLTLIHGQVRSTINMIYRKYYIPIKWVKHFIEICNVCSRLGLPNEEIPKEDEVTTDDTPTKTDSKNIIDLYMKRIENVTDEKYQILFYVDRASQYVLLRPLRRYAGKDEIAFELLKLFANFGVPKTLVSHLKPKVFHDALELLSTLSLPYDMPSIEESASKDLNESITQSVSPSIANWKKSTHSENWTSALCTLQFETNTAMGTKTDTDTALNTPYYIFFNTVPNIIRFEDIAQQEEKSSSTLVSSRNPIKHLCGECSQPVYRKYRCWRCKDVFHFTCCERSSSQIQGKMTNQILSTCFTCKRIPL